MADRLDTMLRDYVRFSSCDLFDDDEAVDAFIGTDHLLDAVDRAALLRSRHRWTTEPPDYCRAESAHEAAHPSPRHQLATSRRAPCARAM